ncbi:hypothetical protein D3C87_1178770 [compost metagenome]
MGEMIKNEENRARVRKLAELISVLHIKSPEVEGELRVDSRSTIKVQWYITEDEGFVEFNLDFTVQTKREVGSTFHTYVFTSYDQYHEFLKEWELA